MEEEGSDLEKNEGALPRVVCSPTSSACKYDSSKR